jgi:arylsulfatase A-like enzyme
MKTMTQITALLLIFLSFLMPAISHCAEPTKAKSNIVFILADDLGYGDIEAFGGDLCNIDTPHFDRLCAEGMAFTNAHVSDSVCVPSRTSIMTGRYAFRFGKGEKGGPWGFAGLRFPSTQHTLGDMFQAGGYTTGYVGKWHLGTRMATRDGKVQGPSNTDFTKPILIGPSDYGFESCFFLPGSLDMFPYAYVRGKSWQGAVTAQKGWSAFNRVGPAAEDFKDTEVLGTFCREAGAFIKAQATSENPFFLFVALTAPHTPTSPEAEFEGKSRIGIYGDFVMNTDACIGRIRGHLSAAGIDKNTLVMVSSDHGPGHYSGLQREATAKQMQEMEKDGHHATGPWRGYKFSAFEGGLRVPFAAGGDQPRQRQQCLDRAQRSDGHLGRCRRHQALSEPGARLGEFPSCLTGC